jgi:hypothetical protein
LRANVGNIRAVAASRSATVTLGISMVVVAAIGAAAGVAISRRAGERVSGRVTSEATSVGSFSFSVNDCASGEAFVPGFFGADLRGEGSADLRVVDSGAGARLWLYPQASGRPALGIGKQSCTAWDVLVDWAHVTVNRVKTVSGHVHVRCAVGGGTVTADVTFERCAL